MAREELDALVAQSGAVIFHSGLTDLDGLPAAFADAGMACRQVELGMGDSRNRDLFHELREHTGHATLPQVFMHGAFVGGLRETRARLLLEHRAAPPGAGMAGYAGLLPFALPLVMMATGAVEEGVRVLIAWAAVILSFVGAIHWGLALGNSGRNTGVYAASVVPATVAWVALLLPPAAGLVTVAGGLLLWRAWEVTTPAIALPRWFRRLRNHLTLGATLCLGTAVVFLLQL